MPAAKQSEHIQEHDLELYLKAELSNESISVVDAHLTDCGDCVKKLAEQDQCLWYLAELSDSEPAGDNEKRRSTRVATDEAAAIQMINPFCIDTWDVRIVDVSKGGLRTFTPRDVTPGTLVKIKMQYSVACGDIRYCVPAENGFYAGVRLHDYFFR
jgi:hypothetical protein